MNFFQQALFLQLKRLTKNKGLLAVLCLLPFFCLGIGRGMSCQEKGGVAAGICLAESSPLGKELVERLTGAENGLVQFIEIDTLSEMQRQILKGDLECGFFLEVPLEQAVEEGSYRKIFTRWQAGEGSSLNLLFSELLASQLMQLCGGEMAVSYMEREESLFGEIDREEILLRYQAYLFSEEMMELESETAGQGQGDSAAAFREAAAGRLIRGILAIFLLTATLLSVSAVFSREALDRLAPVRGRTALAAVGAAGLGLLCLAAALAALILCPLPGASLWWETASLLAYQFALCGLACLLGRWNVREEILLAFLPFVVAGCLIFCPIVVDAAAYLPELRPLSSLLLPSLYLKGGQGSPLAIFTMVFFGFLLFLLALTKWEKQG